MFEKGIDYHIVNGTEVEEGSLHQSDTTLAQKIRPQILMILFLASCVINVGFTIEKLTDSTLPMSPSSAYGQELHLQQKEESADRI